MNKHSLLMSVLVALFSASVLLPAFGHETPGDLGGTHSSDNATCHHILEFGTKIGRHCHYPEQPPYNETYTPEYELELVRQEQIKELAIKAKDRHSLEVIYWVVVGFMSIATGVATWVIACQAVKAKTLIGKHYKEGVEEGKEIMWKSVKGAYPCIKEEKPPQRSNLVVAQKSKK